MTDGSTIRSPGSRSRATGESLMDTATAEIGVRHDYAEQAQGRAAGDQWINRMEHHWGT